MKSIVSTDRRHHNNDNDNNNNNDDSYNKHKDNAGSNNSREPITNTAWVCARLYKLQKGFTRLAAASDMAYQSLGHGR